MYKMITIDVDDTLIDDEKQVSSATKSALAEAVRRGVHITLATGRMYASAQSIAAQLHLDMPLITYQGAFIKQVDGKVLYEKSVPPEAARFLFHYAEDRGIHIQSYCNDILYTTQVNQKLLDYCELSNVPYTRIDNLNELLSMPMHKVIMIDEPEALDAIMPAMQTELPEKVHMTKSKPHFLEFMHPNGTKGDAVRFLADFYNIELSQVIAIGDSWNDHEMIEVAGLGVAMGNAVPSLKQIADYITLSNNEDGVKHVIDKFILNS